jgi:hypothetical protein
LTAWRLENAATIGLDRWIDQLGAKHAQTTHRPFLIRAGEPRITRDVRRENCS